MYDDLVTRLRAQAVYLPEKFSKNAELLDVLMKAADAIENMSEAYDKLSRHMDDLAALMPRWIPVTERLPEMHEYVLICNDDYGKTELGFSTVAVWDGSDWVNAWDGEGTICCVTHWMPLPEPPKEE